MQFVSGKFDRRGANSFRELFPIYIYIQTAAAAYIACVYVCIYGIQQPKINSTKLQCSCEYIYTREESDPQVSSGIKLL